MNLGVKENDDFKMIAANADASHSFLVAMAKVVMMVVAEAAVREGHPSLSWNSAAVHILKYHIIHR